MTDKEFGKLMRDLWHLRDALNEALFAARKAHNEGNAFAENMALSQVSDLGEEIAELAKLA